MQFSVKIESAMAIDNLKRMTKGLQPFYIKQLNTRRAHAFRKLVREKAESGGLMLDKISEATIKLRGGHSPMFDTGALVNHMKIRPMKRHPSNMSVGYFKDDKTLHPESKKK